MAHRWSRSCWNLGLAGTLTIGGVLGMGDRTLAQVLPVPDATLGLENSVVSPGTTVINGVPSNLITGGAIRQNNLFHSFSTFNIGAGQSVYFANPVGIQNILTRVTGGGASLINGRLGVDGAANLFLLNPNGIVFGAGAVLDVSGSFVASTADRVAVGNEFFGANTPIPTSQLLNIQPGALFLDSLASQQASITNTVPLVAGQNLSLVAGNVTSSALLQAGGLVHIEAADIAVQTVTAGSIELVAGQNLTLNGSQLTATGNITAGAQNQVFINDTAAAPVNLQAGGNLDIQGGGGIAIQTLSNPGSLLQSTGNLKLQSTRGEIAGSARLNSGADLSLVAGTNVRLNGGTFAAASNLWVSAIGTVQLLDPAAPLSLTAGGNALIEGGDAILTLAQPTSLVQSGGSLTLQTTGTGAATATGRFTSGANLEFDVGGNLTLNSSQISATAGSVSLSSRNGLVEIRDSPTIPTTVTAGTTLLLQGNSQIDISVFNPTSQFQSVGDLNLVSNGGVNAIGQFITGGTFGITTGGDINGLPTAISAGIRLSTPGNITLGAIDTSSTTGNGGTVSLTGNAIAVDSINTSSSAPGNGNGGGINLSATSGIAIANFINTSSVAGVGGNVTLQSTNGNITTGGAINTASGLGGGKVILSTQGNIVTTGIDTSSASARGGDIQLTSRGGSINTTAGDLTANSILGRGGDVSLDAKMQIDTTNINTSSGTPGAFSFGTVGGNITLTSQAGAIDTRAGTLDSSSVGGSGGGVIINASGDIKTADVDTSSINIDAGDITLTSRQGSIDTTAGTLSANVDPLIGDNGGRVNLEAATEVLAGDILTDGGSTGASGGIRLASTRSDISIVNTVRRTISSRTLGNKSGGDIEIEGRNVTLSNVGLDTSTSSTGNGGSVKITALSNGSVLLNNGSSIKTTVDAGAAGNGGNIEIEGGQIFLDGSPIIAGTEGAGKSGNIKIIALNNGLVSLTNITSISTTSAEVNPAATGNGGDIAIAGGRLAINNTQIRAGTKGIGSSGDIKLDGLQISLNDSTIAAGTQGGGDSGAIAIDASGGVISLTNSTISTDVNSGAAGKGGDIIATAQDISLTNGSQFAARTRGTGNAGNIQIFASGTINISGADAIGTYSSLQTSSAPPTNVGDPSSGRGGNITINSQSSPQGKLRLADGGFLSAGTASDSDGGDIKINVTNLELLGGGRIVTSAFEQSGGAAGNIEVNSTKGVVVSGKNPNVLPANASGGLFAQSGGRGDAGSLTIRTPQLLVEDNAQISVATTGSGMGGRLDINTTQLTAQTRAKISASTEGIGKGGQLTISTNQLQVLTGAEIAASTSSVDEQATGGVLTVNASESVVLDSLGKLTAQSTGRAAAGNLSIATPSLLVQNGAQAIVSSTNDGDAGTLDINARFVTLNNGGKLGADTGSGSGGNIQFRGLETLNLDNSEISASTEGGQGGSINIPAARSINLNNSSKLIASATDSTTDPNDSGTAGNLSLFTPQLTIQNDSVISTSAVGKSDGGQIFAQVGSLFLSNRSRIISSAGQGDAGSIALQIADKLRSSNGDISASSDRGGGGNITISARDIELKNSSLISTSVFSGSSGGGNISISASQIFIALEDSDILANAEDGNGGNITIRSPIFIADLFANVGQNPGRDFSRFRGNGQVDISASSRFGISGVVSIPDFSFLQDSLDSLSETFVSPEQVVAGSCLARRNVEKGSFVIAGTGGLPNDPYSALRSRYQVGTVQPIGGGNSSNQPAPTRQFLPLPTPKAWKPGDPIQEAQGFLKTADGRTVLGTDAQLSAIAKSQEIICGEEPAQVSTTRPSRI